ncbi:hypothetical protein E1B28_011840 [Marasmius oreades]|uniref:Uncharacterized protein n=1 Tax=Marasmius oreades TaxID=181124 RepID=A0A9P7URM2_9AGAR|nr:uncharacterized protein E1B28_011840 [Marasmius oreades]KAG7090241.1 hypothetical protein E1B28_011840 [Marasmius oreades]
MRLFSCVIAALAGTAFAAPSSIEQRQVNSNHGTIVTPTSGSSLLSGGTFDFKYIQSDWCHDGYSPVDVYLTSFAPTAANLNSAGGFSEGDYTYFFGSFLAANFGLPVITPAVPTSLTLPALNGISAGSQLFLAVVETARSCPPGNVPPQYGLTSTAIVYG